MSEAERLAEWLEEKAHNHAQDDIVEWSRMVETAALLRTQSARIAALEDALRGVIDAANSFCDCDGDFVADQVKIRARKALVKGSE